ncbi:ChaN family lipoprotein [Sneathiella sp.]|uniref:ChaN family lipoprotein n=1 Tax=Sneathiella sp. TaxID=1964365 RepID=UPI0039E639CC
MKELLLPLFLLSVAACAPSDRMIAPSGDTVANARVALENGKIATRLQDADFILIGEKHDNPDHHNVQLALLQKLLKKGDVVVFEMINQEQQPVIDRFIAGDLPYSALKEALNWETSGWPDWAFYGPLFEQAQKTGARMVYGNYPKSEIRQQMVARKDALNSLDPAKMAQLNADIKSSHCDLLPDEALQPMSNIQIARDKLMARQLADNIKGTTAFLIAGNGHVRKDRGVPYYLSQQAKDKSIQVLGLIEDTDQATLSDPFPEYDLVWITDATPYKDHCAALKKRFGKS